MPLHRPLESVLGIAASGKSQRVDDRALSFLAVGQVDAAVGASQARWALTRVASWGAVWDAGLERGTRLPMTLIEDHLTHLACMLYMGN